MVIKHIMKQVIPPLPTLFCPLAPSLPLPSSSSLSLSPLPSHHLSSPSSSPSPSHSLLSPRFLSPSSIVPFSLTLPSAVPSSFLSLLHSLTFPSVLSPQLPSPSPFSFLSFQFLFPSPSKLPSLLPSLLLLAINKYISCCTTSSPTITCFQEVLEPDA